MNLNGAYHLQLDSRNDHVLGLGLGVSFTQHMIDVNKLNTYLPSDPAVLRGYNNQLVPDANFGVQYRFKNKGFTSIHLSATKQPEKKSASFFEGGTEGASNEKTIRKIMSLVS